MPRAPFQILVLPFRKRDGGDSEYAIFRRADLGLWQGIAGGGEDGELPIEAARREALEEAGIPVTSTFIALQSTATIPVTAFAGTEHWGDELYVVPENAFGVDVSGVELSLSAEHSEVRWLGFDDAERVLTFDSNKVALWELNQRIRGLGPRDALR